MTPRLIFLHLPRTGGTTLIYEHLFPGVPLEERYHANYDKIKREVGGDDPVSWPVERRERIRFLVGHMPFGLADLFEGPFEYATMLRDPMTRTVSDYAWCRRQEEHECHALANELSLVEFIQRGYSQTNNCYTRSLSGATYGEKFASDEEMLAAAQKTLEQCAFVGITEHFDVFVNRLRKRYRSIRPTRAGNRLATSRSKRQLSPEETEIVRQYNALDIRLYDRWHVAFLAGESQPGGLAQDGAS